MQDMKRWAISYETLLLLFALPVTGFMLLMARFDPVQVLVILGLIYVLLRHVSKPLSRFIARLNYGIRWKFEIALLVVAMLFLSVSIISFGSMDYMHEGLHDIQDLGAGTQPDVLMREVNALEDTNHGAFFSMIPFFGVVGVLVAAALGAAMAWSVIDPVRRMSQGMRRMASGDLSQPIEVQNRDELGELADRINSTAQELAWLQEAAMAEERARALQEQIKQVAYTQEEERRRISRELHDGLGPSLAAIGNRLRACQRMVRTEPQRAETELGEVVNGLKGHIQEIRGLIYELRPLALDQLGLVGALQQQVERFSQETGMQVSFSASVETRLDPLAEVTVVRVVQECLSNAQEHAGQSQVEVRLQDVGSGLEVKVSDNGPGFDLQEEASSAGGKGVGLASMRERADLLRGTLSVRSSPGHGCEVVLFIPAKEASVGAYSSPSGG